MSDETGGALDNQLDGRGRPICPVCGLSVLPAASVSHLDGFIVHLRCWIVSQDAG
jgi:hypothetical protein